MYRFMVGNDFHFPAQDDRAIDLWFQVMRYWRPDQIDLLGDISDGTEYSRHVTGGTTEFFNKHDIPKEDKVYDLDAVLDQVMENERPAREFIAKNRQVRKKAEIHVWDGNHECLDLETKAVTKRGSLHIDEITLDDEVLSLDENGKALWVTINKIIRQPYKGKMYSGDTKGYSFRVTPNHRIVGFDATKDEYVEYYARDINSLSKYRKYVTKIETAARRSNESDFSATDEEIRLTAWLMTDSYMQHKKRWIFYQSGDKRLRIEKLLLDMGLDFDVTERDRDTTHICGKKLKKSPQLSYEYKLSEESSKRVSALIESKKMLPDWLFSLSKRQAELFLREYVFCDGTSATSGEAKAIYVCDEEVRYGLRLLAVLNGFSASENEYRPGHWRINLRWTGDMSLPENGLIESDYNGEIWCLNVPGGQFFVERRGKMHLTGNSPRILDYFDKYSPNVNPYLSMEKIYGVDKINGVWHSYSDEPVQRHGDLYLHHGNMVGTNAGDSVKKHIEAFGVSMVIGHCHRVAHVNKTFNLRGEVLRGYENGHMCDKNSPLMGYTNNKNWQQGFMIGLVDDDGRAHVNQITITDDYTCMVNGRIFSA